MKFIPTLLAIVLFLPPAFGQQYQNASEVPDLVKQGYKGKVKTVAEETYSSKMIGGKPVRDTLGGVNTFYFNTDGFLVRTLIGNDEVKNSYGNDKKLHSNSYYTNGKLQAVDSVAWLGKKGYVLFKYNYNSSKKQLDKKLSARDTVILNDNYLLESYGNSSYNYFGGTDTVIYTFNKQFVITGTTIEKDAQGNKTKLISSSDIFSSPFIVIYRYEYYD